MAETFITPTPVQASTGTTDAMGAWSHTAAAPDQAGNVYIVQVLQDGTNATRPSITSVTNAENLAGTDNVLTYIGEFPVGSATIGYQHLWIGRALNTSAMVITGANAGNDDVYVRVFEYADVNVGTALADVIENVTAGSTTNNADTSATIADADVTTLGPDRLCLNFVAGTDDNSLDPFTGETGGKWVESFQEYADSAGTDGVISQQTAFICSFGTSKGLTLTDSIQGTGGTFEELAQRFNLVTLTVASVYVVIRKIGDPTDKLIIEFQTDSGGLPSGTRTGTSSSIDSLDLTTKFRTYRLSATATLSSANTYYLVLRRDGSRDASNYYQIARSQGDVINGSIFSRDSGTWSAYSASDFAFGLLSSADLSGGTISGGTDTWADATDGWGVVGFALRPVIAPVHTRESQALKIYPSIPIQQRSRW